MEKKWLMNDETISKDYNGGIEEPSCVRKLI